MKNKKEEETLIYADGRRQREAKRSSVSGDFDLPGRCNGNGGDDRRDFQIKKD